MPLNLGFSGKVGCFPFGFGLGANVNNFGEGRGVVGGGIVVVVVVVAGVDPVVELVVLVTMPFPVGVGKVVGEFLIYRRNRLVSKVRDE